MTPFLSFLGVLIGWLLNELGRSIRSRIEDKRRIAKILSSFLYIRRIIKIYSDLPRLLLARTDLPSSIREHLEGASFKDRGELEQVDEELRNSVLALSEVDPLLAFELRTWIGFRPVSWVLGNSDEVGAQVGVDAYEDLANSPRWKDFEQVIRHLAWRHGFKTWWGTRIQLLKQTIVDDATIDRIASYISDHEERLEEDRQMEDFLRGF